MQIFHVVVSVAHSSSAVALEARQCRQVYRCWLGIDLPVSFRFYTAPVKQGSGAKDGHSDDESAGKHGVSRGNFQSGEAPRDRGSAAYSDSD